MKKYVCIISVASLFVAGSVVLEAAPKPRTSAVHWQLGFEFHDLQRIEVVLPGDEKPTSFWYLLYTVTNESGQEVEFYPSFELVTDTLQVVTGGDRISPVVYDLVLARHKKAYPFLCEPMKASGRLLQGIDNARTSVAVFNDFDRQSNSVTLYVGGLSGETARVANPGYDAKKPEGHDNKQFFALRKTLAIEYDVPGDPETRRDANAVRRGQGWVMR